MFPWFQSRCARIHIVDITFERIDNRSRRHNRRRRGKNRFGRGCSLRTYRCALQLFVKHVDFWRDQKDPFIPVHWNTARIGLSLFHVWLCATYTCTHVYYGGRCIHKLNMDALRLLRIITRPIGLGETAALGSQKATPLTRPKNFDRSRPNVYVAGYTHVKWRK